LKGATTVPKFLVYRYQKAWRSDELAGCFDSLKEAKEYAEKCRSWGYQAQVYRVVKETHA
jgi:hypothetical protein